MRQDFHVGIATVDKRTTKAFVVEHSRRRTLVMAVLSAGFAVIGVAMLLSGDTETKVWGGASLVLFGGGAVVLAMSFRRPGRFSLTPAGLLIESRFGHAFVPWDAVVSVERTHIQRQEMLTVDVTDPAAIATSQRLSWLTKLNEAMGMPDLAFPTSLLGKRADALERAIAHYVAHPEGRSQIGSAAELDRVLGTPAGDRTPMAAEKQRRDRPQVPAASRAVLWLGGVVGFLITVAGALGGPDPGRETSHLLGVLLFGTTSVAALLAAWLISRLPRIGRAVGITAAGGGLFIGWLLTQSSRSGLGAVLIGIAVVAASAYVGWTLFRWSGHRRADGAA